MIFHINLVLCFQNISGREMENSENLCNTILSFLKNKTVVLSHI